MQPLTPSGIVALMAARSRDETDAALDRARAALKEFREARGISAAKWESAAYGRTTGTLGKFIRGTNRDIGLEALLRLAAVENTTVAHLIGETAGIPAPSAGIDRALLAEAIATIEQRLQRQGQAIEAGKKALAILVLYDAAKASAPGTALDDLADNVLRLALHTTERKPPR